MNEITTLNGLATGIREKHQAALDSAANAVSLAREAGELLIQAKAQVAHGKWAQWLKANVQFSERTAQGYMRLVRELPKLDSEKAQRVAVMPLRQALRAIADQSDTRIEFDPEIEAFRIVQDIREAVEDWNECWRIFEGGEGSISHAVYLFGAVKAKHATRMELYREGLHNLAVRGLSYKSPWYQATRKAVSTMEALGEEIDRMGMDMEGYTHA